MQRDLAEFYLDVENGPFEHCYYITYPTSFKVQEVVTQIAYNNAFGGFETIDGISTWVVFFMTTDALRDMLAFYGECTPDEATLILQNQNMEIPATVDPAISVTWYSSVM